MRGIFAATELRAHGEICLHDASGGQVRACVKGGDVDMSQTGGDRQG